MNSLYTSIELNDRAVSLLEQGAIENALQGFRQAMTVSKKCLAVAKAGSNNSKCNGQESLDAFMMTSVEDAMKNQEQEQHVYRQPIRFGTANASLPTPIMVSTAVIFNLALAMQLMATAGNDPATSLTKSHQLYELAHQCLSTHQNGELLNNSPLFVLAIMNNMGMIHTQLNQSGAAQEMFQKVMQMIMFLTDCGEGHMIMKLGTNSTCFFNNVQSFIAPVSTAAAA